MSEWQRHEPIEPDLEPRMTGQQPLRRRHGALVPTYRVIQFAGCEATGMHPSLIHHMRFELTSWSVRQSPKWWW